MSALLPPPPPDIEVWIIAGGQFVLMNVTGGRYKYDRAAKTWELVAAADAVARVGEKAKHRAAAVEAIRRLVEGTYSLALHARPDPDLQRK